jgi:hypothetical protein
VECERPIPRNQDFDAQPPGGLRIRVPGHVRPHVPKHFTCQSLHCGRAYPQACATADENKTCDIGARQTCKLDDAAAGACSESSPFLQHFSFGAGPRLKLWHLVEATARDAGRAEQPYRRPTRWPSARCPAGSNDKNAHGLDSAWRSLDHLAPTRSTDNIDLCNH